VFSEISLENRVLIVDDEDMVRDSVSTYLEDSGFKVDQADNGQEGLEMIRRTAPDVVLLDLRMPGMDGLEVLEAIAKELKDVPVIVVTGAGVLQDAVTALRLGAFDFITKPIVDMAVLEHSVRRAMEHTRLLEENRRYHANLEDEIRARTHDLQLRSHELESSNTELKMEMAAREKTAAALRQSESRLKEIVSIFEGFIYTCDAEFRLDFINRKLAEHVGSNVTGQTCHRILHGLDHPCPECRHTEVFTGHTAHTEYYNEKDGRWYDAIQAPVFGSEGQVRSLQAVVIDITERKAIEERLRQREAMLAEKNRRLQFSLHTTSRFGQILGRSRIMQSVYENILKAAESSAHVIIYGESGTGKELVAKTIHELSDRGNKQFVTVNCGAIPDNLVESEFFGYSKGAFTGADQDKTGYLDAAHGGTMFMDEVGELNLNMQVKLLRAIEGGGYSPIGSSGIKQTDIRIVAATNRDLQSSLKAGRFRKDFFYRIHILPIYLPPLRLRKEDIPILVNQFANDFSRGEKISVVPQHVIDAMQDYDWPGNVRELQNTVHRYITLGSIDLHCLPRPTLDDAADALQELSHLQTDNPNLPLHDAINAFEKRYIEHLLNANQWHRSRVAELLGIDRRTLFRKMKAYGL